MIASDKLMNNDKPYFYRDNWYSFAAYGDFIAPVAEGYHIKNDVTKFFQHDDFPTWSTEFNFVNEVAAGSSTADTYISESNGENCVSFKLKSEYVIWPQNSTIERRIFKDRPDYMTWDPKRYDKERIDSHIYMPTNSNNLFRGILDKRTKIKGFQNLDFSFTKDAQNAFFNCNFVTNDFSFSTDTYFPSVKKAQSMFEGAIFNTQRAFDAEFINNANKMNRMFRNSSGGNLYVMLPENVEQHSGMFSGAKWNHIYVNGFGRLFDSNSNAARSFGSTDIGYGRIHLDPIPNSNIYLYNSDISSQFAGCDMQYTSGSASFNVDAVKNMQHTFDNCKMNVVPYIGELFGGNDRNFTAAFQNAHNFNVQFYRSNVGKDYNNWNLSAMFKDAWDVNVSFTSFSNSQNMLVGNGYLFNSNLANMFYNARRLYIPCNGLAEGFTNCDLSRMFRASQINFGNFYYGNNLLDKRMNFSGSNCSSMFEQSTVNINTVLNFYNCKMSYAFYGYGASNAHVTVNIDNPVSVYGVAGSARNVYITGNINSWNKENLGGLYAGYNFNNRFICGEANYNDAGTPSHFYSMSRYYNNSSLDANVVSNYMFRNMMTANGYCRYAEAYLDFSKTTAARKPQFPRNNSTWMFRNASIRYTGGDSGTYCSPESFANASGLFDGAGVINWGIFCYDDYADYRITSMSGMFHGDVSKAAYIGGMPLSSKEDYWNVVSKFNVYLLDTDENSITVNTEFADSAFTNSHVSFDYVHINRSADSTFNTARIDGGSRMVFLNQSCTTMRNIFRNSNVSGEVQIYVNNYDIYANNAFRAPQGYRCNFRIYLPGSFWNWRRWENAFRVDFSDYKETGEHIFYINTYNQQTYDSLTNGNGTIWSTIAPTLWRYGSTVSSSGGYYWRNWSISDPTGTYTYKFAIRKL